MSLSKYSRILLVTVALCLWRPATADTLLVLGDSLSAGYGLPTGKDWVSLLQQRLATDRPEVSIVNASISGETTAGGKRRIEALLDRHDPVVLIVGLGANDGLRGIRVPLISDNLSAIVDSSRQSGARTLILGMHIPPNYGRDYAEKFHAMFGQVSDRSGAALVPFMLDGFAADMTMFQDDGIHPAIEAQPLILDNIYPSLLPLFEP